jgi:hypothetical protein
MKKWFFAMMIMTTHCCFTSQMAKESEHTKNQSLIRALSISSEDKEFFLAVNNSEVDKIEIYLKKREADPKMYPPVTNVLVAHDALKYAASAKVKKMLEDFHEKNSLSMTCLSHAYAK